MLGKKEQAEALGSDLFTRSSAFEFLGQILWAESRSVWRKLTAGCKNSVRHSGWQTPFRHGAQTSNAPPNRASQTCCLKLIWGWCRSRHNSTASPSSLRTDEELMEQQVEKALHVPLLILFMNTYGPHSIEMTLANVAIIIFTLSVCFTFY